MSERPERPPATDDSDPFEAFNRAQGIGSVRDPHSIFAALRREAPVRAIDFQAFLGGSAPEGQAGQALAGVPAVFAVLSHDAVAEVLRDPERFSSRAYENTMGVVMGHTILEMDPPEHTRSRDLLRQAFTKRELDRWEEGLVKPVVHQHIDRFAARGHADLVRELTFPFPVIVIAGLLGLPADDLPRFHRWAVELISVGFDWQRALAASERLEAYFRDILAQRRAAPGDDLVSLLASAELDGERLPDDAIIAFLRLLLPAGAETTYRSASNLLFGLLDDPAQLAALADDRKRIPLAIEEGLRWESPLTGIIRVAARDTELAGVAIPQGALLHVGLAAANHDEAQHAEPERFDIDRNPSQHMAFGFGAHRCLGMHLARMETRVVLEAILDRLPDLQLDPAAEDVGVTGLIFRAPLSLPVRFTPA